MSKPRNPKEFVAWSTEATCGSFSRHTPTWYATGQNNLQNELHTSAFFAQLHNLLQRASDRFRELEGAQLFALGKVPTIEWNKKSYESFLEKLFRWNCVENELFPLPPNGGWISLDGAFSGISDIVRTTIFVAYADGSDFLARAIEDSARDHGIEIKEREHAHEKGYYARHIYVPLTVPVASRKTGGEFADLQVAVEIQIATQLQGALREITHFLYEKERLDGDLPIGWKHDFRSGRFRAAYMAHSLRFIEAMIVELREAVTKESAKSP